MADKVNHFARRGIQRHQLNLRVVMYLCHHLTHE